MKKINISNKKFGRLTAIRIAFTHKEHYWECLCDCGNTVNVRSYSIRKGFTKSCGCIQKEIKVKRNTIHGHAKRCGISKIYRAWRHIINRCTNHNSPDYPHYGGRGITICDSWLLFSNFLLDMGEPNDSCLSIDRINNNGNYEPSNCRWATPAEQANNTRRNILIEFNNHVRTIKQWSHIIGVRPATVYARIFKLKWPIEKALHNTSR